MTDCVGDCMTDCVGDCMTDCLVYDRLLKLII